MKIFAVAGGKGGTGKSTLSANIAAGLAYKGFKVALVDCDPEQESIDTIYGGVSIKGLDIYSEVNEKLKVYDYIILDYPPAQNVEIITDNVIVVLEPDNLSEKAFFNWQQKIKDKNCLFVFNKVDTRINDERRTAKDYAKKYNGFVMAKQQVFRNGTNESKTVFCYKNKYGASKARNDINLLIGRIDEQF